nr:MAG TPA: hypothetical protein [Caudoviricetes sp.]
MSFLSRSFMQSVTVIFPSGGLLVLLYHTNTRL